MRETSVTEIAAKYDETIADRLRRHGLYDGVIAMFEAKDAEIERLREAIRQADYVFELITPENHSQTTDSELASLLSSVGEKLSEMVATWDNAVLGEKE